MPNGVRSSLPDKAWTDEVEREIEAIRRAVEEIRGLVTNQGRR